MEFFDKPSPSKIEIYFAWLRMLVVVVVNRLKKEMINTTVKRIRKILVRRD